MGRLSARGLENVRFDLLKSDFTFIVGDVKYACNKIVADFLSPMIANYRIADASVNTYRVKVNDPDHIFPQFLALGMGKDIVVSDSNRDFLAGVARELKNGEILMLLSDYSTGTAAPATVLETWRMKEEFGMNFSDEILFFARQFHKLPCTILERFKLEDLMAILSSDELKIVNEDWLFNLIADRMEVDRSYVRLFEFVRFAFLSTESIVRFVATVRDIEEARSGAIWTALCSRLTCTVSVQLDDIQKARVARQPFEMVKYRSDAMAGILAYLMKENASTNLVSSGILAVTATPGFGGQPPCADPIAVTAVNTASVYRSDHQTPNPWICYHFLTGRVAISGYGLRTAGSIFGGSTYHPRSWIVEISENGEEWKEVHRCTQEGRMNSFDTSRYFSVTSKKDTSYVKIRMSGPTFGGDQCVALAGFELFGKWTP